MAGDTLGNIVDKHEIPPHLYIVLEDKVRTLSLNENIRLDSLQKLNNEDSKRKSIAMNHIYNVHVAMLHFKTLYSFLCHLQIFTMVSFFLR